MMRTVRASGCSGYFTEGRLCGPWCGDFGRAPKPIRRLVLQTRVDTRRARDSVEFDLDADELTEVTTEWSALPAQVGSSDLDSSKNITVRPPHAPPAVGEGGPQGVRGSDEFGQPGADKSRASEPVAARGMGLSWEFLRRQMTLPLGIRLRALVEALDALSTLHGDLVRPPNKRVHGALWYGNMLFRNDGTALFLSDESVTPQPTVYTAPELRRHRSADPQTDCYAIGVMLLEALADQSLSSPEVSELTRGDLERHPFWGRLAGDPLLWVAVRATEREPARRWPSAREFVDAIGQCAFERIAPREELGELIRATLAEQGDRATPLLAAPTALLGAAAFPGGAPRAVPGASRAMVPGFALPALPVSPLQARALALKAEAESQAEVPSPEVLEGGERAYGIAVSVPAAQRPSHVIELAPLPSVRAKGGRRGVLYLLAAIVLSGAVFAVFRGSHSPTGATLAAERDPRPLPLAAPSYDAPALLGAADRAATLAAASAPNAPSSVVAASNPLASSASGADGLHAPGPRLPTRSGHSPEKTPEPRTERSPKKGGSAERYEPDGI
jgi:hypothetical protein